MMDDGIVFRELKAEVTARFGGDTFAVTSGLFHALWARRDRPLDAADLAIPEAETLGHVFVAATTPVGDAVRLLFAIGQTLTEVADDNGPLTPVEGRRLQLLIGEAAAQVAGAMERALHKRRDAWLAFLSHELKNPLSTILNALWLIRDRGTRDPGTLIRFVEMAERAVRRVEAHTRDVRELEERLGDLPPGWRSKEQPSHPNQQ
jgi:signal transduction histidine kinase